MDNAPGVINAQLAEAKARTAALFRRPSKSLEAGVNGGHPALLTLGISELAGGRPIVVDGQVVGAVGISVAAGADDDPIAELASHALDSQP